MASHEGKTNATPANPSLPQDLIVSEIFSRLPAESLSDLKDDFEDYNFESWKSLISSPEFAKTHLSNITNDPRLTHHRLLLVTWPLVCKPAETSYIKLSSCSVNALLNDDDDDESVSKTVREYHPAGDADIHVLGYCNGLFCLIFGVRSSEKIFLWNPFTSDYTKLPKHEHEHRAHGFCYDESNDDYKVFALCHPAAEYKYNVSVYSSKSGCWRIIGDYYFGKIRSGGSFASGAIHWLVERKNTEPYIIVSIDIKTETYREVPLPPTEEDGRNWTTLDTFGESLSVLYSFKTHAYFWVMKECGVEESWTKLFTIPFIVGSPCPSYWWNIKPLCISIGGDLILESDISIVLYNPKSNTFKKLLNTHVNSLYTYTYVESLVSPPN